MDVYSTLGEIPADFGPSAVTIGKFDGVHRGHLAIIEQLRSEAHALSLRPTVLTFDRNPLSVLRPDTCPLELVSNAQKLSLLATCGVEATVMLEFTRAFSEHSPREFVEGMLVNALHANVVLVGTDFRFGRHGDGDVTALTQLGEELGFNVVLLQNFELPSGLGLAATGTEELRRVSSTWVRELLMEGDVRGAAELLGRDHIVRAPVVRGAQRGRQLGFPTANLSSNAEGFIPADGVYAAWVKVDGHHYRAAVSVGNNPTFDGVAERQVEAHLLGGGDDSIDIDLYGNTIDVLFVDRLRGMLKFDDLDSLIAGISNDVALVRALLPDEPVNQ